MKKIYILPEDKLKRLIEDRARELYEGSTLELEREVMSKKIHLASLQSQINPHFLYNALEGIRGQAILDDAPVIADIAQALADYFRYSISSRRDVATLQEELANVRNYLRIQQFRFPNRFQAEISYDQEDYQVLETVLPKLTLQPIFENAINHAFVKVQKDALISVKIIRAQKSVAITVSDNGVGMDREKLEELNRQIQMVQRPEAGRHEQKAEGARKERSRHNGVAMPNIDRRIKLMFGGDYGLHVSSIPDVGTDVEIYLPFCVSWKEEEV